MLVANPRKEKLCIEVKDSLGFADLTVGTGEVRYLKLANDTPHLLLAYLKIILCDPS